MSDSSLRTLFIETLKDTYYAEKQILKALPKMAAVTQSDALRAGLLEHREQTEGHVARLEQVFEMLETPPRGKTCDAIPGIVEEAQTIMKDFKNTQALDAGLAAAAQAVEHYEIARYGTLRSWALRLGLSDAVPLLEATLAEEAATNEKLRGLAETEVDGKAS